MWTRYSSCKTVLAVCAALAFHVAIAPQASADAKFFPDGTKFKDEKLDFGGLLFKDTRFRDFRAVAFEPDKGSATETYETRFKALVDFEPVKLTGLMVKSFTPTKPTDSTATFETEIISMELSGGGLKGEKLELRVSSIFPSTGIAIFTDGKEPVLVDSFFDVFFELTVDGEPPIRDAGGSSRYTLVRVPEPASLGLLLAGLLGFSAFRRQLQRRKRGER